MSASQSHSTISRTPQRLAITTVPTVRQRFVSAIYKSADRVLSLDPATLTLTAYYWCVMLTFARCHFHCLHRPVQGKKRMAPDAFRDHRETHQFLGPCCLCPLLEPRKVEPHFTEAAIYVSAFGRYAGEYVAECAKSQCGYLGRSPFSMNLKIEEGSHGIITD